MGNCVRIREPTVEDRRAPAEHVLRIARPLVGRRIESLRRDVGPAGVDPLKEPRILACRHEHVGCQASVEVEQMSTNVELISKDSEEGQLLLRAFGGVAAILRYRVT